MIKKFIFILLSSTVCAFGFKVTPGNPEINGFKDPELGKTGDKGDIIIQGAFGPVPGHTTFAEMIVFLELFSKRFDPENKGVKINTHILSYKWDQMQYKTSQDIVRVSLHDAPVSLLLFAFTPSYLKIPVEIVEIVDENGQHTLIIKEVKKK